MRILGIDPGLATVGLGLVDTDSRNTPTALDWLTITTKGTSTLSERLEEIHADLRAYLTDNKPDLVVVERLFFATNRKTAIDVAQARGVILHTAAQCGLPVLEPTPLQLKTAIAGDGKADKRQVQDMVMRTLRLTQRPQPDDAADALALALYGAFSSRSPSLHPKSTRRHADHAAGASS